MGCVPPHFNSKISSCIFPKIAHFPPMTPGQARAARALLGWSQVDLAAKAGVSVSTVRNFEREATSLMAQNERALRLALEAAGVAFLEEPYREGVALKPARRRSRKFVR